MKLKQVVSVTAVACCGETQPLATQRTPNLPGEVSRLAGVAP
ncbi:hypothetical protein [Mycobacterium lepromatosis]|nr:hypothetical protein [Mycobacterium lepromatosis]